MAATMMKMTMMKTDTDEERRIDSDGHDWENIDSDEREQIDSKE